MFENSWSPDDRAARLAALKTRPATPGKRAAAERQFVDQLALFESSMGNLMGDSGEDFSLWLHCSGLRGLGGIKLVPPRPGVYVIVFLGVSDLIEVF